MKRDGINRARTREAGFSLVELLVSLVLLSMVAALLASGLTLGQRVWGRSEERAQASRAMFDAQTALRRMLDNMQPLRSGSEGSRAVEFRGSADELDAIVPLPPHIGLGGLYRLHLFRNRPARRLDLTLYAYERGMKTAEQGTKTVDDAAALTTLVNDIDGMELRYFGKVRGEETPNWRNAWQGQEELPALISIRITGAKAGVVWPELLIAPRVKPVDWR
jgi:general secretion pathway protein J